MKKNLTPASEYGLDFIIPGEEQPYTRTQHTVPAHLIKLRIEAAMVTYVNGRNGSYLKQEIALKDWSFTKLNIFSNSNWILHPYSRKSQLALEATTQGNIHCYMEGEGELQLTAGKNHTYMVPGGKKHIARITPADFTCYYFCLAPHYLQGHAEEYAALQELVNLYLENSAKGKRMCECNNSPELKAVFTSIERHKKAGKSLELFMERKLLKALLIHAEDIDDMMQQDGNEGPTQVMMKVKEFILQNLLNEDKTLFMIDNLARRFGMSPSSLKQHFKAVWGITIARFIVYERIQVAIPMVRLKRDPFYAIAERLGYEDAAVFSKIFKRETGKWPREMQQE